MVATVFDSERELTRVWLRKVIGPILEGLGVERRRGARGNWGFRASDRKLEFALTTPEMVASTQHPNLEQFLRNNAQFRGSFSAHDAIVTGLAAAAGDSFDDLLELPEFAELTSGREDKRVALAEYVVNQVERLPDYYSLFSDWEAVGAALRKIWRDHAELAEFEAYEDLSASLVKESNRLHAELSAFRDEIADRYRLPAVDPDVQ